MILIKTLSFFLLLPCLHVVMKLIKKKEINFFDLILIFTTLYFAFIPLKSNQSVFDSIGRINDDTSIIVFLYLLFFFLTLLICSHFLEKKINTPINLTFFLKHFPTIKSNLWLNMILIFIPVFSLYYYIPQMSLISSFSEIQKDGVDMSYEASSMVKFFSSIFSVSLILSLLILFQNINKRKFEISNLISVILFLINLLLLSRRQLILYFLFAAILFYSFNRELINKKFLIYLTGFGLFIYFVYFPFYNIIRRTPVEFQFDSPITSLIAIYEYGIDSYTDASGDASELTEEREIGLYRAVYWLAQNDTENDISWGKVTLAAIDHAIPKIINPGKGLGSEVILQNRMNTANDSADSVLLLAFADFSILGSVLAVLIYYVVYRMWLLISNGFRFFFDESIVSYYFAFFLFKMSFSIEQKLDGILADTVAYFLVCILIISAHKGKLIRMEKS